MRSTEVAPAGTDERRLLTALVLIAGFMAAEAVVGILVRSLALLSDAGHTLSDAGALGLAVVSIRLARRPPKGGFTFGLKRTEILSALANGVTLLVLAGIIVTEAVRRLITPGVVPGGPLVAVAVAGIAVNAAATWQLGKASRRNVAVEGSFLHIVTDLYALIGTAIAGGVILLTGFARADSIASLAVAALMVQAAQGLVRKALRALLEASPAGLNPEVVGEAMAAHPHVASVHDLHIWEITSGFPALSAHVLVHPGDDCHAIRLELVALLRERFQVDHTTLQVEHDGGSAPIALGTLPGR